MELSIGTSIFTNPPVTTCPRRMILSPASAQPSSDARTWRQERSVLESCKGWQRLASRCVQGGLFLTELAPPGHFNHLQGSV